MPNRTRIKRELTKIDYGTHICHLYGCRKDIIDVVLPYFVEGQKKKQSCLWVAGDPLDADAARQYSDELTHDTTHHPVRNQIEIVDQAAWCPEGKVDPIELLKWLWAKLKLAGAQGFEGLRIAENMSRTGSGAWHKFMDYEAFLNGFAKKSQMTVLCSYPQDKLSTPELIEVMSKHRAVLMRVAGQWVTVLNSPQKLVAGVTNSDYSYAEIGRVLGISRQRVKELVVAGKHVTSSPEGLMTIGQAAKFLNVSVNTVRRWDENGIIRSYRFGLRKDRRFKRQDVDKVLALTTLMHDPS